jgi:hypothetical protein
MMECTSENGGWHSVLCGSTVAKFIVPDSSIGLSYRPAWLNRLAGRYNNSIPDSTLSTPHSGTMNLATAHHYITRRITEYTEWQRPLSGIHSIMMEKLDQTGEGGGCAPAPLHYIYHHVQSCSARSS